MYFVLLFGFSEDHKAPHSFLETVGGAFDFPKVNNNYDDAFYNFNLTIHYNTTTKKVKSVDIQSDDKKLYIVI